MNPRIQVEHTVTEEVTNVDLVQAQMRIAAGETLADLELDVQENIKARGFALQCRITTEDPSNGFRPDTGTITSYRSPGGPGVRLDGGTVYTGATISAHFDSMLSKLTCRGRDFATAVGRAERALGEFHVGGVSTNISFLKGLLAHPDFRDGAVTTTFIDEHPELLEAQVTTDPADKILAWLADVTVNKPHGSSPTKVDPALQAARRSTSRRLRPTARASCSPSSARRDSPRRCASARRSASPTRRSVTRTSHCWRPAYARMTS